MKQPFALLVATTGGLFICKSDLDRQTWKIDGPHLPGWEVYTSIGDSRTTNRLFAGAHHRSGGATIFYSDDFGAKWQPVEYGPSFPKPRVFDYETFQWLDNTQKNPHKMNFSLHRIWHLALGAPSQPHTLYAGTEEAALFVSHDGGMTWEELEGLTSHPTRPHWGPGAGGMGLHTILVDPTRPERIWVAMSSVGIFRTDDGGKTWTVCNERLNPVPTGKPREENIGSCIHKMALDPQDPNILYIQDHGSVQKSIDGAESWFRIEEGLGTEGDERFGFPIVISKTGDLYLFPLTSSEHRVSRGGAPVVFRSTNRGESWHPVKGDYRNSSSYVNVLRDGMTVDELDPYGLYFGTSSGELFYTLDRGDTWHTDACPFPPYYQRARMGASGVTTRVQLFVGTKNGLFRYDSDESRDTWRLSGPFLPGWTITALYVDPGPGGRLIAATKHLAYGPSIRVSHDAGESWQELVESPRFAGSQGYTVNQIWRITCTLSKTPRGASSDRPQPPVAYYCGTDDAALFRSLDAGIAWRELTSLSQELDRHGATYRAGRPIDSIVVDPSDGRRLWVAHRRSGVYRTHDAGESWQRCDDGLPPIVSLMGDPTEPGLLYAQTADGMFRSTDGATSWERANRGLPSRFGFALHAAGSGRVYTIPLQSQTERHVYGGRLRVYRSVDAGASWAPLSDLSEHLYYAGVLRDGLATDALGPGRPLRRHDGRRGLLFKRRR